MTGRTSAAHARAPDDGNDRRIVALRRTGLLNAPRSDTFDRFTRLATTSLGAAGALVCLVDTDHQFFLSSAGVPEPWASRRGTPMAYSFCRHVVAAEAPVLIEDARVDPLLRDNPAIEEFGIVAYAGVPLTAGGHVLGALCVFDAGPRVWTDAEATTLLDLAAAVSAQMAIPAAVHEAATRTREVEDLLWITSALNAAETEEAMVTLVADRASVLCDSERTSVGLLHGEVVTFQTRLPRGEWETIAYTLPARSITRHVLSDGRPYRTNDLASDPLSDQARDAQLGLRSQLSVPIMGQGGQVLGLFSLFNKRGGRIFTEHDEALAVSLATQTGVAIERARSRAALAQTAEALRRSEERFRSLVQNAADVIVVLEPDGIIRYISPGIKQILGYDADHLLGNKAFGLIHEDDLEQARWALGSTLAMPGTHRNSEYRFRHADGSWRTLEISSTNLLDDPSIRGIVLNASDVTERRKTEEALRRSEERFRSLVQNASDLIVVITADGVFDYFSPSIERLLGYQPEDLHGTNAFDLLHPDDRPEAQRLYERRITQPDAPQAPAAFRMRHRDGSWRTMDMLANNLLDDPSINGLVVNMRDITESKALQDELVRQAFSDSLTGLPNRALFFDRLGHALRRAGRRSGALAVLYLDLDGFKVVNDSLGHGAGDSLLVGVGQRIMTCLRPADTIARLGGDEFAVLIEDLPSPGTATAVGERIIDALKQPFAVRGRDVFVGATIGITVSDPRHTTPDDILREADIALYQAKAEGKSRAVLFNARMNAAAIERLELETDLRRAIERHEFVVYYQPEVDLLTGRFTGAEALVRWQHPRRGLLDPGQFIGIAEETGLILDIGPQVLLQACRQVKLWEDLVAGIQPFVVSANLSAREFQCPGMLDGVAEILEMTGIEPAALRIEITESVMMRDTDAALATMHALKGLGVSLAIDDFGTGYSSLSYLRRFPVETLKIDRSFLAELSNDTGTVAIVRAVTTLAHELGMAVTAEGIETIEQVASAVALHCDRGQGYFFSRPLPAAVISELLRSGVEHLPSLEAGDAAD